jgi:transcriptional regulator with XRE-family HTH domain
MAEKPEKLLPLPVLAEMRPERIGHRLKLIRLAAGLQPAQMADLLGIERTYWSRFEGGKRPVTESVAALIVERFGVTLDFIILGRWDRLPFELAQQMRAIEADPNTK